MSYNMTAFGNATNPLEMFAAVNTASSNWLAYLFLVGVFIVLFMNLSRRNPPAESFTAASAVSTVGALLFLVADLINGVWVVGFTLIFALSAAALYVNNKT